MPEPKYDLSDCKKGDIRDYHHANNRTLEWIAGLFNTSAEGDVALKDPENGRSTIETLVAQVRELESGYSGSEVARSGGDNGLEDGAARLAFAMQRFWRNDTKTIIESVKDGIKQNPKFPYPADG